MERFAILFDELKKHEALEGEKTNLLVETAEIKALSEIVYQMEEQDYCYFARS